MLRNQILRVVSVTLVVSWSVFPAIAEADDQRLSMVSIADLGGTQGLPVFGEVEADGFRRTEVGGISVELNPVTKEVFLSHPDWSERRVLSLSLVNDKDSGVARFATTITLENHSVGSAEVWSGDIVPGVDSSANVLLTNFTSGAGLELDVSPTASTYRLLDRTLLPVEGVDLSDAENGDNSLNRDALAEAAGVAGPAAAVAVIIVLIIIAITWNDPYDCTGTWAWLWGCD